MPNPLLILAWYLVLSAITLTVYGVDKHRARTERRRVPERTLQGLALMGGWPGALLGRRIFRHKTRKHGFSAVLFAISLLHVAVWTYLLVSSG